MYNITFLYKGQSHQFSCVAKEDILSAARTSFVALPAGCRGGGCGMCKVKVIEGTFEKGLCSKAVLTAQDEEKNYTLACKTFPHSNMKIAIE